METKNPTNQEPYTKKVSIEINACGVIKITTTGQFTSKDYDNLASAHIDQARECFAHRNEFSTEESRLHALAQHKDAIFTATEYAKRKTKK